MFLLNCCSAFNFSIEQNKNKQTTDKIIYAFENINSHPIIKNNEPKKCLKPAFNYSSTNKNKQNQMLYILSQTSNHLK